MNRKGLRFLARRHRAGLPSHSCRTDVGCSAVAVRSVVSGPPRELPLGPSGRPGAGVLDRRNGHEILLVVDGVDDEHP